MHEVDSGGGSTGTNWYGMSVVDIWMTVQNQDTTPHWQLLSGWRKSYELTLQHLSAVRSYRDNLASAWPPESSGASAAYIARLDHLIENLQQTYDAAVANYDAFSGATLALSAARRELEPVVDEYVANAGKIADYERELASPPPVGEDAIAPPVVNPVAAGRQDALENKARTIMAGLSAELVTARAQLRQPKPYDPKIIDDAQTHDGVPTYVPPPIPPVTPFDPGSGSGSTGGSSPFPTNAAAHGPANPSAAAGRVPGLVLGGVQPPVAAPPAPSPINPPVMGNPSTAGPVVPVLPTNPGPSQTRSPSTSGTGRVGPSGPRGMPNDGVIGARPGAGGGQPIAGRPTGTVNPIGGVIGPTQPAANRSSTAAGHAPPGGSRAGTQPIGMLPGQPGRPSDDSKSAKQWDPDNPWATEKGVDPVLLPPEEPKVDPGPAIGLS